MMEVITKDSSKGIVNQGFNVEFSSEDESSVDVDGGNKGASYAGKQAKHDSHIDPSTANVELTSTSGNFYELPQSRRGSLSTEPTRHESISSQPASEGTARQEFSLDPNAKIRNSIISRADENVQENAPANQSSRTSMPTGESNLQPSPGVIGNSVQNPLENKKLSIILDNNGYNNGNANGVVPTKEYFRDVRLSLDPTTKELPFHNNANGGYGAAQRESQIREDDPSFCDDCGNRVLTNYKKIFTFVLERPLYCFALWALFYILWGDEALPGGTFFALSVLELSALGLGYIAELFQLPGLLGMVAAGLILKNVPKIDVANDMDPTLMGSLRGLSIVILLIRGGLGFNAANIVKFKNIIPPLVIASCVLEAVAATVAIYFIIDFPFEWAALMGCIIAAMSGAVVLPYLASAEKSLSGNLDPAYLSPNYKRIIAVARTGCTLDAMIAICLAEVALGFIFAEGKAGDGIIKGVVEQILGGAFGVVWGFLAGYLLDNSSGNEKRVLAVFAGGTMSLMGMAKIKFPRGGPLAAFLGTVIVATIWRNRKVGGSNNEQLAASFTLIWYAFQPLLYAIIGARTDFDTVEWSIVTKGLICLAISQVVRIITSFLMTNWGDLELKERIYICMAWLPKGTVQAALGPAALDTASGISDLKSPAEYADLGYKIMNISCATFIAASLVGSICLRFIGPRLLCNRK